MFSELFGFGKSNYSVYTGDDNVISEPIFELAARPADPEIVGSIEVDVNSLLLGGAANIQSASVFR